MERLSRRGFLKQAGKGLGAAILIGMGGYGLSRVLPLEEEQDYKVEVERGWAVRDGQVIIRVGDLKYEYFASNISTRDDWQKTGMHEVKFGRSAKDRKDAYKNTSQGITGPYFNVYFSFVNGEYCEIGIKKEKVKLELDRKKLTAAPFLSQYDGYAGYYDFYHTLITVFALEDGELRKKMYTIEPTLPTDSRFAPPRREFDNVWEVIEDPNVFYGFKKGKAITRNVGSYLAVPFVVNLGKNDNSETVAYLLENFWLKI